MSLFGQSSGGSVFGQNAGGQQQQQQSGGGGGGLFGSKPATSLFGQPQQQQQQPQQGQTSNLGGSLFGQPQQQNQPQQAQGSGLFGQSTAQNQQTGTGGSVFGQPQQQTGSAFGGGGGAFGQSTQQQNKPSLFGGSNWGGNSLIGGSMAQPQQPKMGGSMFAPQTSQSQNVQSQAQPSQPAGAYFDSLLAKSQKAGEIKSNMEDLPTLELGLGDLRHRLRKLQSKPSEKPLDGKAHYLLAASGVDPGAAAKELGLLDAQGGRADRTVHGGYAPSEVDVETYLSNLQTKTTLSMIADGLERSVRDFDNFLEDNVNMEWEAQRKRIYQHFGIATREESNGNRESQAAFGRSRKGKSQAGMSKSGRASTLGKSMYRSVIGTPTRVGAHQPEFSDVERTSGDGLGALSGGQVGDRVLRERQARLAEKVRNLNAARLMNRPYPIIAQLAEVEKKSNEPHAFHVHEAYLALTEIVGENADAETAIGNETATERQFAKMYLDDNFNSQASVEMRKRILEGSTRFLEVQFLRELESLIAKHPHEAKLGGLPDIQSKIRAYIRLRASRKDLVPDNKGLLEVNGDYVWAMVFYLLRSGHVEEAARYVNDNNNHFKSVDRAFPTYMNNYASSNDRRIQNRKLLDRCTNEYMNRARNSPDMDPYRQACYKIIGRCDLSNRSLDGLNTDINDWIWLQFNLAREGDKSMEMAGESFGLSELQASVRDIGSKHFPKNASEDTNGSFGMFFYLQVLAGMFEDAIAYLYPFSYVDAVHFALALEFYGLLRPSDAESESNDLRTYSTRNLPQINFGRMLGYYTRDFRAADVVSAVDYLSLICLNQDNGREAGRRQSTLCHEALRELVLETREFSVLIGDIRPDGRRIRGIIEERGRLIGLNEEDDFVNTVTLQAASFADENGRTTDSVLLYHLAGEYDTVVSIVSRALSEAISMDIGEDPVRLMPVKPRAAPKQEPVQGSSLSLAAIDDPIELANTMMSMYEKDAMFYRHIQDQNKMACRVLLEMSNIKSLVEAGQWATSLDVS
jgi:nuclear pore complex protein Nup93